MVGKSKKSKLKKLRLRKPHAPKAWQLILLLIPLLFVTATLLRLDHIRMTELRTAVLQADEEDNDEKIQTAMQELQDFTFSHIVINIVDDNGNRKITFGTGPFYLEHLYLRRANAALEEAEKNFVDTGNPNGNIYAKAMEVCRPQAIAGGWSWNSSAHINCMLGQIALYPTEDTLHTTATATLPSTELFRHNYSSPVWAPTLAGFAILLCVILIILILIKVLLWLIVELSLFFLKKF